MAGGVGNLTVGLGLDYAAYTAGLTKAQAQAQQFAQNFKASFAGNFAAGFAKDFVQELATIPGRLVDVVRASIDAADHLNDLSKKTGIAADTLGGIGFAAKQAGGDLDSAAAGIGKLNKSIAEAAAGSKEAADAFALIGVAVKDSITGATRNADEALADVADKFASYADGPEKAALALKLFGKAGADMIPLLNEGGAALRANVAYFKRYSGVTEETTKAADQFNDTLVKLNLLKGAFANSVAADLLTPLQAIAQRFLESKENGDGFVRTSSTIKEAFIGIANTVSFVVESLSVMATRLDGLVQKAQAINAQTPDRSLLTRLLNPALLGADLARGINGSAGDRGKIETQVADDIAAAQKRFDRFEAQLNFQVNPADFGHEGRNRPAPKIAAPRLPGSGGVTGAVDDPTKKLLEARLKAIDGQIALEQDLLQTRNRFLDFYNQQSLLSIKDYYAGRTAAQAEALRNESDLINQEIALLRKDQAAPGRLKKDAAADEVKIQELIGRRTKLEQQAGEQTIFLSAAQERAYDELEKSLLGVNAQVEELRENFAKAAEIRFNLQFSALSATFDREGNEAGKEAIRILGAAAIAQAAFQKASLDSSRTLQDLANAESRIAILEQTGALTSLEALAKVGDARRAQIAILERQVAAEETLAAIEKAKRTAGADDLVRKAEAGRIALDKLKASADPLAESLNKAFGQEFNSQLDEFVLSSKKASDALEDLGKAWLATLLKMGTKSLSEELFGGSGGAGGIISDLFKNSGQTGGLVAAIKGAFGGGSLGESAGVPTASAVDEITKLFSDTGATAAKAAETAAVSAGTIAVTALTTAATAAAAALSAMATASAASAATDTASSAGDIASLFSDFGGFFASGGTIKPGKWGVVGENGPELAFGGSTGKTIQPMSDAQSSSSGGKTVNLVQNFHVTAPASRDTQQQVFAAAYEGAAQAYGRNS